MKDYRQLVLDYDYPEELILGWNAEECQAEWEEFCSEVISE
ncbi:hypothetical protein [Paenibacillus ihbetae]|nr:hypothetical protein [Paenibacillus ihbetae]